MIIHNEVKGRRKNNKQETIIYDGKTERITEIKINKNEKNKYKSKEIKELQIASIHLSYRLFNHIEDIKDINEINIYIGIILQRFING